MKIKPEQEFITIYGLKVTEKGGKNALSKDEFKELYSQYTKLTEKVIVLLDALKQEKYGNFAANLSNQDRKFYNQVLECVKEVAKREVFSHHLLNDAIGQSVKESTAMEKKGFIFTKEQPSLDVDKFKSAIERQEQVMHDMSRLRADKAKGRTGVYNKHAASLVRPSTIERSL